MSETTEQVERVDDRSSGEGDELQITNASGGGVQAVDRTLDRQGRQREDVTLPAADLVGPQSREAFACLVAESRIECRPATPKILRV